MCLKYGKYFSFRIVRQTRFGENCQSRWTHSNGCRCRWKDRKRDSNALENSDNLDRNISDCYTILTRGNIFDSIFQRGRMVNGLTRENLLWPLQSEATEEVQVWVFGRMFRYREYIFRIPSIWEKIINAPRCPCESAARNSDIAHFTVGRRPVDCSGSEQLKVCMKTTEIAAWHLAPVVRLKTASRKREEGVEEKWMEFDADCDET